jgi:hypothetical protein
MESEGLRKAQGREMDQNRTHLEGLTRRPRSVLRERIADGGARTLGAGSSLEVHPELVVLDLQELARQRLS